MNLKQTTAYKKIAKLRARIWGIQGGQGAGKTIAILLLIAQYAFKNANKEIYIVSAELSKLRDTALKDFLKIIRSNGMRQLCDISGETTGRPLVVFPNGTFIRFIGLDKEDIGKGLRSDLVFINEANKVNFEAYRELTARAKRVILDFNPNNKFWYHKEVMSRSDCQHLVLTYKDNEFIPENERKEILGYRDKGFADAKVINEYWANKWRIYGLGEVGGVEGRIFYWDKCSYLDYLKIDRQVYFGNDWGKSDPWAIGEAKYYDGTLYVHERNYYSENQWRERMSSTELIQVGAKGGKGHGIISWMYNRLAIPKDSYIVCDNNEEKIISLRLAGWDYAFAAVKGPGSINAGIDVLQNINVCFTEESENIEFEQENYCWAQNREGEMIDGKPLDKNNHHMDWIRYLASWLMKEEIIRAA